MRKKDESRKPKPAAPAQVVPDVHVVAAADLDPRIKELYERHLAESRSRCRAEHNYLVNPDGTRELISTRYYPRNPIPGVVYDDNGIPLGWTTAIRRDRAEKESMLAEKEGKLAAIRAGASKGGKLGRATRRDKAARANEALLASVRAYRAKHPDDSRRAIAAALLRNHGRELDHADPADRSRAIAALTKRIERLEKTPLDT